MNDPTTCRYLRTAVVADLLDTTKDTLRRWRSERRGPAWIKLPGVGAVRYPSDQLAVWIAAAKKEEYRGLAPKQDEGRRAHAGSLSSGSTPPSLSGDHIGLDPVGGDAQ